MTIDQTKTTHFGFRNVNASEKTKLVGKVFHSVAPKYDLMNDIMSLGLHRLWKRFAINEAGIRAGQKVLDVASGTGDLALALAKLVGKSGQLVMTDINPDMLAIGRNKMIDHNFLTNIDYVLADAENLPFEANTFDHITIAFGLRNVTQKKAALKSMFNVLKPGGQLSILEFSKPSNALINKLYEFYSFAIIPKVGELVANDKESYQYLVESIRMHPSQEELKAMLSESGFEDVEYLNLNNGIVALHTGRKY